MYKSHECCCGRHTTESHHSCCCQKHGHGGYEPGNGHGGYAMDPVERGMYSWKSAFVRAWQEAQVDILKEKIRKEMSDDLDKAADITLKAMNERWNALMSKTMAFDDMYDAFTDLYENKEK